MLSLLGSRDGGTECGRHRAQLEQGLIDVKRQLGPEGTKPTDPAVIAVLVDDLGITEAKAKQLIREVFSRSDGKHGKSGGRTDKGSHVTSDAFIDALAKQLEVSHAKAKAAFTALDKLSRDHGVDPRSAQFAAIARGLGVTAHQLASVIGQVKTGLAGDHESSSPKPYKS
ncbi:hypothetical protein RPQ02_39345 [Streptomyces sp. AM2-3-1]|uniref:hypothetical protein n=1 Tax=Streptomyces sp. AM2-3-1 TaxID=3075824 RepID=UPI0028C4FB87|nr:hypothetical protein [Streptomyces sp. AM2-3-1]WNO69406.1 hypothetical protein RPQ02_39345 [Streptomyces sp. AM2-3-1]